MKRAALALLIIAAPSLAAAQKPAPGSLANGVVWESLPSADDLERVYPKGAIAREVNGLVRLQCDVTRTGALTACEVKAEDPPEFGFGQAALQLTPLFRIKVIDPSRPPPAKVAMPVRFTLGASVKGAQPPRWAATPTAETLDRYYPAEARRLGVTGDARIQCSVERASGALKGCFNAGGTAREFRESALQIAGLFRHEPVPSLNPFADPYEICFAVHFRQSVTVDGVC